jgi:hypothetical protein
MVKWGGYLLVFGVLGILLPAIGMDHLIFAFLGDARPVAVWGCVVLGAGLVIYGLVKRRRDADVTPPPSPPPPA